MNRNDALLVWVVYDHPTDYPDKFVARQWRCTKPPEAVPGALMLATELRTIQGTMMHFGLTRMDRAPEDDPVIVEVWL